jgi:hypothetical protein
MSISTRERRNLLKFITELAEKTKEESGLHSTNPNVFDVKRYTIPNPSKPQSKSNPQKPDISRLSKEVRGLLAKEFYTKRPKQIQANSSKLPNLSAISAPSRLQQTNPLYSHPNIKIQNSTPAAEGKLKDKGFFRNIENLFRKNPAAAPAAGGKPTVALPTAGKQIRTSPP